MEKNRLNLKDALKKSEKFSEEELKFLPRSFDIIGEIALIQIPNELIKKEKIIAEKLLEVNKNIKTVYKKGKHLGRLRKQRIIFLAGKKQEETIYKENNCLFKLNVKECFFSPRLSTDRLDIAKKVKKNEKVLVMFSGVAPYGIVIGKISKCKKVICIEINKKATKYAKENIKLNKLSNCEAIQGDVKKICLSMKKQNIKFDRIVMPRPQLKETFLKEAFMVSKKGTIIHFHDFLKKEEIEKKEYLKKIQDFAKKKKKRIKILNFKILREIAPYKYNIRIDFKIL